VTKALLVIDLHRDYFPGGEFPLWNTDAVLQNIERAMEKAKAQGIPVVHIQHIRQQLRWGSPRSSTRGRRVPTFILAVAPTPRSS